MKIEEKCALLVIDIQQEDFVEMNESGFPYCTYHFCHMVFVSR